MGILNKLADMALDVLEANINQLKEIAETQTLKVQERDAEIAELKKALKLAEADGDTMQEEETIPGVLTYKCNTILLQSAMDVFIDKLKHRNTRSLIDKIREL